MALETLKDLFTEQLQDMYYAEKKITKALPKMVKKAQDESLKQAFEEHLQQTEDHIGRLEQVFEQIGKKPRATKCPAMDGIIEEGEELIKDAGESSPLMDAGLIMAAQKVEHYEMATYGSLRAYANQLGFEESADLLQQTLNEEGEANEKLTQIAESQVNMRADSGEDEEEESEQ